MSLDHAAIYKAYPNVKRIDDSFGAFDANDNLITIVQSNVDAARVELNKLNYISQRSDAYPLIQDQLDQIYWDKKNGTTTWVDAIDKVKSDYPKSS